MTGRETARSVALGALLACERQGAWSDGALKKAVRAAGLDRRDAALATRLCFGVMQNRMRLDYYLNLLSKTPVDRLEGAVRGSLRLGLYQLMELDRVPDSAAVNESVALVRAHSRNPRAAGMVNAILRNFLRRREELPPPADPAVRYSHPAWLVEAFSRELGGEGVEALLSADNGEPPTCAQVNTVKGETSAVRTALETVERCVPIPGCPDAFFWKTPGIWRTCPRFRRGSFTFRMRRPGWRCWPPGRSRGGRCWTPAPRRAANPLPQLWQWKTGGRCSPVTSTPIKRRSFRRGRPGWASPAFRPGFWTGRRFRRNTGERFDLVMADVPCSGLGIIRKKPDIRYKDPEPLAGLPRVSERHSGQCGPLCEARRRAALCHLHPPAPGKMEMWCAPSWEQHGEFSLEGFTLPGPIGRVEGGECSPSGPIFTEPTAFSSPS